MITLGVTIIAIMLTSPPALQAQERVSFPTADNGFVYADLYGKGEHGVVLAHGGHFNKGNCALQAKALAAAGFHNDSDRTQ